MTDEKAQICIFLSRGNAAVSVKNRMVLAPMQVYTGKKGFPTEWHHHHLAKYALGGFGTVFTEALIVRPEGRNTHGDLGIWSDEFIAPLKKIADLLRSLGVTPATQLVHCGPKSLAATAVGRIWRAWRSGSGAGEPRGSRSRRLQQRASRDGTDRAS